MVDALIFSVPEELSGQRIDKVISCMVADMSRNACVKILEENGVNVTIRRRLGSDVDASCGQLRRKMQKQKGGQKAL